MTKGMMFAATLVVGVAGAAQQPARTVQQDFEAATALDNSKDKAAALAAWEALERRVKPGTRNASIVQVRKGAALFKLSRYDDASRSVRAGLAGMPAGDQTLREDRLRGYFILGQVDADTLDYAGAAEAYAQADALASAPAEKLGALLGLIEVRTFTNPAAATSALAKADELLKANRTDDRVVAMFARRRTALALNAGDFRAAKASAMKAVNLLGGLTQTTDSADAAARADAALALLLGSNPDEARRYMAYTGAGHLPNGSFDPGAQMAAPECGGEAELKPGDVAVVEFSIASDGTVARAVPIYAAGGGKVALEFARAVRGWSWPVEQVQAIPPFFRNNARVEMRCSTAFERPSVGSGLDAALEQWLANKGAPVAAAVEGPQAAAVPRQRAALAAAEARSPTSLPTLAAVYRLAGNPVVPREEQAALMARGLAIAAANDAPSQARLALELPARLTAVVDLWKPGVYARSIMPLLSNPVYASDPASRAAIRLMLADNAEASNKRADKNAVALALLRQVADDPALARNDPLRVGALVRIASIEQRNGQVDAARAAFASTGLTASQCAIMDAPPKMISMPGSEAFPMEALRWGFEGWTQVQYDIGANGKALNQRVLLSYPPFIFSKAGEKLYDQAQFAKTYRPDGGLGCGATTGRVVFKLPNRP